MTTGIFSTSGGEISVWLDGGIMLKVDNAHKDPVEMSEDEALELVQILQKLVRISQGLTDQA